MTGLGDAQRASDEHDSAACSRVVFGDAIGRLRAATRTPDYRDDDYQDGAEPERRSPWQADEDVRDAD